MALTNDDVKNILNVVDNAPHIGEIELVCGGLHLRIHRDPVSAAASNGPAAARPAAVPSIGKSAQSFDGVTRAHAGGTIVRAPAVGVFHASPAPGQPPFVRIGQPVGAGDTVGLVGATDPSRITAGAAGTIREILVDDGDLVEFDQALFVIEVAKPDGRR